MRRFLSIFVGILLVSRAFSADPLTKLTGCARVPTDWADGDSFQIRTGDGKEHTLRLYGVDCIECYLADKNDARRLSGQRRYFGISAMDNEASIVLAKAFGKMACDRVTLLLKKPFTIHTAYADARGDGRHERIYGFVTLADGSDLAEVLVKKGLARAFGVSRETPDGKSRDDYREALRDLELQAAKRGSGVWAKTNWEKLPAERQAQRREDEDLEMATGKGKPAFTGTLDPNTASRDDLMKLPGVGEVTALAIIEGRPYKTVDDLMNVPGLGPRTFEKLRPHLKIEATMQ